jgi:SMODS and SLOG-associating 2TM effector domain 2
MSEGEPSPRRTRRSAPDLRVPPLPPLDWSQAASLGAITEHFRAAERQALAAIDWYLIRRRLNSRLSRLLRGVAILLGGSGGIIPLVHSASPGTLSAEWGYVLLAASAGCVLFDRFFGFSSSWMRFMRAEFSIQHLLVTAQCDWVTAVSALGGAEPSEVARGELLDIARNLHTACQRVIEEETATWVADLTAGIEELHRSTEARALPPALPPPPRNGP